MKKLIGLAVAGMFLSVASITAIAQPVQAQGKKEMTSICQKIKDEKRKAACLEQEAQNAADKAKGKMKK